MVIGSALDIVEHCGVPRYLFTDFPLGNPCGPPWQSAMQLDIVQTAASLLIDASAARTTLRAEHRWPDSANWRQRYGRVDAAERERLRAVGEERRKRQAEIKSKLDKT